MQLCNWKLLFWSCHQSFTSLMQPALIDNYLMMISRSTSRVCHVPSWQFWTTQAYLHISVSLLTLFWPRWIFLFFDFKICAEEEGRGSRRYVSMPLPSAISHSQYHIFISEISHCCFFDSLIGIAVAKLLFPQHQILWMTQKELRNLNPALIFFWCLGESKR